MGGRGSSSGISDKGKKYGTEYKAVAQFGEIKVVRVKGSGSVTAPIETITKNRVYATIDKKGDIKHITFYDTYGERVKQIDVKGRPHNGIMPHSHLGYEHNEMGDRQLTDKEHSYVNELLKKMGNKEKTLEYIKFN